MQYIPNFRTRLIKSMIWLIFTVLFGLLLPMFLVWLDVLFTPEKTFPFDKFIKEGSFIFFATAVVASITLDHILSEKFSSKWNGNLFEILTIKNWNLFEILALFIFPAIIFSTCIALFYISNYGDKIDINLLWTIEFYILLATFIHGIIIKFLAFK